MTMRLGRREFAAGEPVVLATAYPPAGRGTGPGPRTASEAAASAVERAVDAGADVVEVGGYGPVAELVATIRSRHPRVVVGVRTPDRRVAEAAVDAGADVLASFRADVAPWLVDSAAAGGTGLVVGSPGSAERAAAAGVRRESILVAAADPPGSAAGWLPELVAAGWPVLVALPDDEPVAETLTAAAICAWLGARAFRTGRVAPTRQAVDMVATLRGAREPAVGRRGLV